MSKQKYIELFSAILANNAAAVKAQVLTPDFDFGHFLAFTNIHQLSGYLYLHIKGSPLEDLLPSGCLERLAERYAVQQDRCADVLSGIGHILDAFSAAQMSVLFLKGPFVAQRFYGDIYRRSYLDIDILIHREDLVAADQLLRDMGFNRLSMMLVSHAAMTRFTHTYDYHKCIATSGCQGRRQFLPLDLHWRLRSHYSFRLDYENIWARQEQCVLQGKSFPVLNVECTLVMNVLGMIFDIELGIIRLKSFLDLYKMLEAVDSVMDWDAFIERRTEENISLIALNVIDLLLDVWIDAAGFPEPRL